MVGYTYENEVLDKGQGIVARNTLRDGAFDKGTARPGNP